MSKYKITGIIYIHIGMNEGERDRQTDRKTDRQADRDRQTDRDRESECVCWGRGVWGGLVLQAIMIV